MATFVTELSNISERITPPPPINEIDNNTTEKNVPDPNPAGNNTYSLHTFTGGFVNIKDSTSEECHLYPGKYILKVSELDKKIKLEIRTKDKVIFSDIVSNMEKEINIETEDIYNICLHYFEGSTKYIVALKGIENNSTSYEFYSGIVHIGESNHYGCKLSPGRYTLNISELDYNVKLEILNKGNIIFSDIVSNMNTDINIDVEDNYDFYISYHNGFTKYKIELNET